MHKMAVMGDRESVLAFKALGLETVPSCSAEEARQELFRMAEAQYAVIYMTEQIAAELRTELEEYADQVAPAIILIPGRGGSLGIGLSNVRDAVERAVGADILGE